MWKNEYYLIIVKNIRRIKIYFGKIRINIVYKKNILDIWGGKYQMLEKKFVKKSNARKFVNIVKCFILEISKINN